jgi:hypothetical protein
MRSTKWCREIKRFVSMDDHCSLSRFMLMVDLPGPISGGDQDILDFNSATVGAAFQLLLGQHSEEAD